MDGQPRIGLYDVGADEYALATIVRKPLKNGDVGPSWLSEIPGGGSPGCGLVGVLQFRLKTSANCLTPITMV